LFCARRGDASRGGDACERVRQHGGDACAPDASERLRVSPERRAEHDDAPSCALPSARDAGAADSVEADACAQPEPS
jgi:hypothetical protein